jgi:hypothetical protein
VRLHPRVQGFYRERGRLRNQERKGGGGDGGKREEARFGDTEARSGDLEARSVRGEGQRGREWLESAGIWPAAEVEVEEGGGRREEEGGGMGLGRPARVWNRFCSVGGGARARRRIWAVRWRSSGRFRSASVW